jgi:lipoprotein
MIIKNKLSICVVLSCIAFALVGCSRTAVNVQGNQVTQKVSVEKNYFPYENLHELSIDKNAESENIKSIINKLPMLADYLEIKNAKIENTDIGVGLVLEYDEI